MSGRMNTSPDEFDVIAPEPMTVRFKGREVLITPLTVGQLPAFARAVRPFAGKFSALDGFSIDMLLGLLADHGEHLLDAVSIATRIKRSELDDADPAELIGLIAPVINVNADFFGQRLRQIRPQALAAVFGAGQTPSPH